MGMLACYVEADVELLDSLKELDEDELLEKVEELYNPSQFAQNGIYPHIWMREDEAELRQELIENIVEVKEFYQRLLCKKKGVIVSIY